MIAYVSRHRDGGQLFNVRFEDGSGWTRLNINELAQVRRTHGMLVDPGDLDNTTYLRETIALLDAAEPRLERLGGWRVGQADEVARSLSGGWDHPLDGPSPLGGWKVSLYRDDSETTVVYDRVKHAFLTGGNTVLTIAQYNDDGSHHYINWPLARLAWWKVERG